MATAAGARHWPNNRGKNSMSAIPIGNTESTPERNDSGHFAIGNKAAVGNAGNRNRRKLLTTITEDDIDLAVNALRRVLRDDKAKGNDIINAAREMLDRATGKPAAADLADRVENIEAGLTRILEHLDLGGAQR
jgi:hypothetical protein